MREIGNIYAVRSTAPQTVNRHFDRSKCADPKTSSGGLLRTGYSGRKSGEVYHLELKAVWLVTIFQFPYQLWIVVAVIQGTHLASMYTET